MFKTKNLVHNIKDVPTSWIFEHFCKLPHKLNGVDVKIKSLFNPKERTASMCIYTDKKDYKYKDFSTGKGGSAIDLVKDLYQIPFHKACQLIVENYNDYVLHNNGGYDIGEFKQASRYKVTSFKVRGWTTQDQYFWTQFNIGSKLLEAHNVRPLESYCMTKDGNELCIKGLYLYGYFKEDGSPYKIYQPKTLDKKFIKIESYIQGWEQLQQHKNLVITSSLKDIMSIKSLKLHIDVIAPDSENTMLKSDVMEQLKKKYNKIIVLFDNDEAGIKAMEAYKEKYPFIEITVLPMSKDISDSIKDSGAKEVRNRLVPILDKKLSNGKKEKDTKIYHSQD
jgi:5S rRNA maturation endonuclease (ribonuclease M5)